MPVSFLSKPEFYLCMYGVMINAAGFILFGIDKHRAKKRQWRIPEKSLFLLAFLGGSLGCLLGMRIFHHKTRHQRFVIGIPAILCLQAVVGMMLVLYFGIW